MSTTPTQPEVSAPNRTFRRSWHYFEWRTSRRGAKRDMVLSEDTTQPNFEHRNNQPANFSNTRRRVSNSEGRVLGKFSDPSRQANEQDGVHISGVVRLKNLIKCSLSRPKKDPGSAYVEINPNEGDERSDINEAEQGNSIKVEVPPNKDSVPGFVPKHKATDSALSLQSKASQESPQKLSTAYIPRHAASDFAKTTSEYSASNIGRSSPLIERDERDSGQALESPTDYDKFLEESRLEAAQEASTKQNPPEGVLDMPASNYATAREKRISILSSDSPPTRKLSVRSERPSSRIDRPGSRMSSLRGAQASGLGRSGSVLARVGEYIKPERVDGAPVHKRGFSKDSTIDSVVG
ncbi:hypothetical protein B0O99DRAFT_588316 [Bisporella sp. PMI_857]|nr:hypothetical protein B0O99DRAFT_588316 [Bisporella sp. PMI_857]